jgi:subtilisin family serine protease
VFFQGVIEVHLRNKIVLLIAACIFRFLSLSGSGAPAQSDAAAEFDPHRVIVKFKPQSPLLARTAAGVRMARLEAFTPLRLHAGSRVEPLASGIERIYTAQIAPGASLDEILQELAANPDIEYAEPDYIGHGDGSGPYPLGISNRQALVPTDPEYYWQWGLQNAGQLGGRAGIDVNAVPAWDISIGDSNTILAVLDTGLALNAPDFSGRIVAGYDYVNGDSDPSDDYGHGTNVTSIAAAAGNNAIGTVGMNWKCRIMPIKILDLHNSGLYSWWASGIIFAADHGARVINISAGGTGNDKALADAVAYARSRGVIIVACMMNTNSETAYYPAAYPGVIAVGAVNNRGLRAVPFCYGSTTGSNFGSHIAFVAPGNNILGINYQSVTQSSYWCGTSQATPFVSGLITLLLASNPSLNYTQIYSALKAGARDQIGSAAEDTAGWDKYFGWGLVDSYRSLLEIVTTVNLFPQMAIGGGYSTIFTFVNTGASEFSGTLLLSGNDGSPLNAALSSAGYPDATGSSFPVQVNPGGTQIIAASAAAGQANVAAGWARVIGAGGSLGGVATYQLTSGGRLSTIAGVLSSAATSSASIPVDDDRTLGAASRTTGYAVANQGSTDIYIRIFQINPDGSIARAVDPPLLNPLRPGCHVSRFLWEDLNDPSLQFRGSMVLNADSAFSVVALGLNQGLYTAIPVIPAKAPSIR